MPLTGTSTRYTLHNDSENGTARNTPPLLGMTLAELETVAAEAGLRKFAAKQIARRLYVNRARSIDEMTELPKASREWLSEHYCVGLQAPIKASRSADGTVKISLRHTRRRFRLSDKRQGRTRCRGCLYPGPRPRDTVRLVAGGMQDGM